jgi:hypothetical protein
LRPKQALSCWEIVLRHAFLEDSGDRLVAQRPTGRFFWNRIPKSEREKVVEMALEKLELSPRKLACRHTDTQGYFIFERSVLQQPAGCGERRRRPHV